jgi:hypothetical protein
VFVESSLGWGSCCCSPRAAALVGSTSAGGAKVARWIDTPGLRCAVVSILGGIMEFEIAAPNLLINTRQVWVRENLLDDDLNSRLLMCLDDRFVGRS